METEVNTNTNINNNNNNKRKRKPIRKKKNKKNKKLARLEEHQDVADSKQTAITINSVDLNESNSQPSQQSVSLPEVEFEYETNSITDNIQNPELKNQFASILQRFGNKSSSKKISNANMMPQDILESRKDLLATTSSTTRTNDNNTNSGDIDSKSQQLSTGAIAGEEKPAVVAPQLSNRQRRKLERRDITTLKLNVTRPELVEKGDVNSPDPLFLLHIKSTPHTVPVPRHWSLKRKYLQSKRGVSKPPFTLPSFIASTGISVVRNIAHLQNNYDANASTDPSDPTKRSGKFRQRQRMRGKLGQMSLEYGDLYDAFFKYQTKPKMTGFGEVYYENKEHELKPRDQIPGVLSKELKIALGMDPGPGTGNANGMGMEGRGRGGAVPWAEAMLEWGLPPWYRGIQVPGVNVPPGWEGGRGGGNGEARWGDMVEDVEGEGREMYAEEEGEDEDDEEGEGDEEDEDGEEVKMERGVNGMQTPQGLDLRKLR